MNGTSSATAGDRRAIALILEANPALTWRDVKHILASTARQIDAARAAVSVRSVTVALMSPSPRGRRIFAGFKFHDWYGFGMSMPRLR